MPYELTEQEKNQVVFKGYTLGQLHTAFDVAKAAALEEVEIYKPGEATWKNPFTVLVEENDKDLTVAAIQFFLADNPTVTKVFFGYLIQSKGYQA